MPRHSQLHAACFAALAFAAAAPAFAATPIDQTRPLDPNGQVEIDNLKGRIQVRAWDRNEVRVTGSLGAGVEKLVVEGGGRHLLVKAQYPRRTNNSVEPTTLLLQVPLQASLDIDSVSADIDIDGVAPGDLQIETVSGDIVVAAAPQRARIESVSGDQRLTLNSPRVGVETVSGDVVLNGRLKAEVAAETVSGDIRIDSRGEALRSLRLNSVSGNADARIALASGGEVHGETVSGDVRLVLPHALSARVEASSFSGDLEAPDAKVDKQEFGPGSSLEHRYGNGDGEIHIETFSGDAELVFE
ncbi:MAG TPA: DUF4097 family beta strand repeat-containing protein [Lysobacter sp.]|nr:DUF4097 family beta strand repeat-containing protein [Lysobacter sp.]